MWVTQLWHLVCARRSSVSRTSPKENTHSSDAQQTLWAGWALASAAVLFSLTHMLILNNSPSGSWDLRTFNFYLKENQAMPPWAGNSIRAKWREWLMSVLPSPTSFTCRALPLPAPLNCIRYDGSSICILTYTSGFWNHWKIRDKQKGKVLPLLLLCPRCSPHWPISSRERSELGIKQALTSVLAHPALVFLLHLQHSRCQQSNRGCGWFHFHYLGLELATCSYYKGHCSKVPQIPLNLHWRTGMLVFLKSQWCYPCSQFASLAFQLPWGCSDHLQSKQ